MNVNKKVMIFLILVLSSSAFAQSTSWFQSEIATTDISVSSTIDFVPTGDSPYVESVRADVLFVPIASKSLAINSFEVAPDAILTNDRVRYFWKNPTQNTIGFSYNAEVDVANQAPRVTATILYPFNVPQEYKKYLEPTEHIDSRNPLIVSKASELAKGQTDLFVLVSSIARWVKTDISYNLSTLTSEVSQPASWVLQNKIGVCDEITSLFIAMMRSLGIPAKFVSGIAFTNSPQFSSGWGAHGWAEVYFPGAGWVPFDPTFGEYGWVDPGHIKMHESFDPAEPTTTYEWKSRDVSVKVHDLTISANHVSSSGTVPFELSFTAMPFRPRIGFGSYNAVVFEAYNTAPYYTAAEFTISPVNDLTILSPQSQLAIVPPNGKAHLTWIVKLKENLDKNFQYEIPVQVSNVRNDTFKSSFFAGPWDVVYDKNYIETSMKDLILSTEDSFELACVPERDMLFEDDTLISCIVTNKKEEKIKVSLCFEECELVEVLPMQSAPKEFEITLTEPGHHNILISATANELIRNARFIITRADEPLVSVTNITAPKQSEYGQDITLNFHLARESISLPKNVVVTVNAQGIQSIAELGSLQTAQDISLRIDGSQIIATETQFDIEINYEDDLGKSYSSYETASTKVTGIPWYTRIVGWVLGWF